MRYIVKFNVTETFVRVIEADSKQEAIAEVKTNHLPHVERDLTGARFSNFRATEAKPCGQRSSTASN